MYIPFKKHIKHSFPKTFEKARTIKNQIVIELNTLRQVGIGRILKQFVLSKEKWKTELPLQKIRKAKIKCFNLEVLKELCQSYKEGGHTLYFPPSSILKSPLQNLVKYMPENVGIKIVKREGGINTVFAEPDKTCFTHSLMSPSHHELILIHSIFYSLGLGPRLYDAIEIEFENDNTHVAYILEHIEGTVCTSKEECENFIHKIKNLENSNLIKLINWNGYNDMDFSCPTCNGNLLFDVKTQSLKYVDLQNFSLNRYHQYLQNTALEACKASHFGQQSYLMGGEYLYQEIPGLNLAAKRSPSVRFEVFKTLLGKNSLSLHNKLVIDVGCNIGLMGAQYLKDGAAWLHGFDMPNVVNSTEKILLSIGCTRFSTTGMTLNEQVSLIYNLPGHLKNKLNGCVISYLAIRGHIGWIKELAEIPWDFILYEGHQEEDKVISKQFIQQLQQITNCYIVEDGWIADANSTPRYIAIIKSDSR